MKRFWAFTLIISVLAMSGCGKDNMETAVTETAVVSVTESVTESETTETTTEITTETTTEIAEQELVLRPIPTGEEINALECTLTELELSEDETLIPENLLEKAKQLCFESVDPSDYVEGLSVGSAEEVLYGKGVAYDFDLDGEDEYIFMVSALPHVLSGISFVAYGDGEDVYELSNGCNPDMEVVVMDYEGYRFMKVLTTAGAISYSDDIYSFNDGVPEIEVNVMASHVFDVCGNMIYCYVKYAFVEYPLIFCEDGKFRWFAVESITEDDFKARVENGVAYLEKLRSDGKAVKEIYTCGNCVYYLTFENGDDYVLRLDENKVYIEQGWGYLSNNMLEGEFIYGGDVWSVV